MAIAPARSVTARASEHRFYLVASLLAALIVLVGFSRTYFLKQFFHTPPLLPIIHLHAVVFTSWIALFITQSWLVSARHTRLHMRLGIAGFLLAILVVVVGASAAVSSARLGQVRPGLPPPSFFLAILLFTMLVFAVLVAAGFLTRRRPDYHKRIMIVATTSLLAPAFARMTMMAQGRPNLKVAFASTVLLVLVIAAIDTIRHRRLHPAFALSVGLFVFSIPLRFLIARTDAWMSFARWITS